MLAKVPAARPVTSVLLTDACFLQTAVPLVDK